MKSFSIGFLRFERSRGKQFLSAHFSSKLQYFQLKVDGLKSEEILKSIALMILGGLKWTGKVYYLGCISLFLMDIRYVE